MALESNITAIGLMYSILDDTKPIITTARILFIIFGVEMVHFPEEIKIWGPHEFSLLFCVLHLYYSFLIVLCPLVKIIAVTKAPAMTMISNPGMKLSSLLSSAFSSTVKLRISEEDPVVPSWATIFQK